MNSTHLKRDLSKTQLLFISFAAIFGSGWLFSPLYAAQIAGPFAIIAWGIGALISLTIGITMAEVVILFPKSGGLSAIARKSHGEFLALLVTTLNLVVFIILPTIEVRAVLQYFSTWIKSSGFISEISPVIEYGIAFFLLALVTLVNLWGARVTAAITKGVVFFKILTPVLVCVSFSYVLGWDTMTSTHRLTQNLGDWSSIPWTQIFQAIATSGIIFSYNGFNQATLFAGEAKNPKKAIPFAILGSLLFSAFLYMAIQTVFIMAVPEASLAHGWQKLAFPGDEGPFAGLAALLGLGGVLSVIYLDSVLSPLGTAFTYASAAPRLFYSLAEGSVEEISSLKLNRYGVSPIALLITLICELAAFILLPNLKAMIALLVAAFVLCYTTAPASLLVLRKTHPQLPRPFQVKWAPIACYLSVLFSNLMVFSCGWVALRNLSLFAACILGFYLVAGARMKRPFNLSSTLKSGGWFFLQLIGLMGLAHYQDQHSVSFGWTLFAVGLLSLFALFFAVRFREN